MTAEFADPEIRPPTPPGDPDSQGVGQEIRIHERAGDSLDGREFVMQSSTASRVDPDAPTRFRYHEASGVIWGDYSGDTVTQGRFVGSRVGDRLEVAFAHASVTGGAVVRGQALSRIETDATGVRLVEEFEVDGGAEVSVCVEVPPA